VVAAGEAAVVEDGLVAVRAPPDDVDPGDVDPGDVDPVDVEPGDVDVDALWADGV